MFSDIPSVRAELDARLREVLPAKWKVEKDIEAPDATLTPAVYIEFRRIGSTFDGQPLPHGVLAAEVQLILTDPRTDRAGEGDVEDHLVNLIAALDPHEDLAWTTAEKQRVERTGSWSWALTLFAFVDITIKE
ncbi:MAG TPA: hypothetical protein VLZ78_05350 [Terrimesophilobacter sp.]|nr:hypothetical protein [Terrimesophilobacter sp.]